MPGSRPWHVTKDPTFPILIELVTLSLRRCYLNIFELLGNVSRHEIKCHFMLWTSAGCPCHLSLHEVKEAAFSHCFIFWWNAGVNGACHVDSRYLQITRILQDSKRRVGSGKRQDCVSPHRMRRFGDVAGSSGWLSLNNSRRFQNHCLESGYRKTYCEWVLLIEVPRQWRQSVVWCGAHWPRASPWGGRKRHKCSFNFSTARHGLKPASIWFSICLWKSETGNMAFLQKTSAA